MARTDETWFETGELEGKRYRNLSKFFRTEYSVSLDFVSARWPAWSRKERSRFAAAFAARSKLVEGDQYILDFLMENGDNEVGSLIAHLIVREYPDRDRALKFLLSRVKKRDLPLASYYQALSTLASPQCVQELKEALVGHRLYVQEHRSLRWWRTWKDTLMYLDYLSCSATLFRLTGEEEYRANLKAMLEHRNKPVRQMARAVA